MKHYSIKFRTGGHLVKAFIVAKNIQKANRMMVTMYPEMLEDSDSTATIRLLCYR